VKEREREREETLVTSRGAMYLCSAQLSI